VTLLEPRRQLIIAIGVGVVIGCFFGAIVFSLMAAPTIIRAALSASPTPTLTSTFTPMPTDTPTPTTTNTSSPIATATLTPTLLAATRTALATPKTPIVTSTHVLASTPTSAPTRAVVPHFLVGRPVASSAPRTIPDPVYLYGTTRFGDLDVHHGEDYDENPIGTPLYAVANGTVVVAGNDLQTRCGDDRKTLCGAYTYPGRGFYGNLVVIQLPQLFNGQRVFALYGHMNKVTVSEGDQIKKGDGIGEIGQTGIADGSHVHFEIRLGVNDYAHTRNPILWMTPLGGRGSMGGLYSDANGNAIQGAVVNIYRATGDLFASTETYSHDKWPPVNDDDDIGENFAMGDMPVGDYVVKIQGQQYAQRVTIQAGKLSFVDIGAAQ
jgi:murein DD-endopeptidase MepM/ murein hydrolase activator NlpD